MTSGGKRLNSGRKKKFNEPTMRLSRIIPIAWLDDFEKWYTAKCEKLKGDK